jgi:lipoprotein-releasing system permease protein
MQRGDGPHTRPIVLIAILGIILGVAVMIISVVIVRGFRTEIRDKVVGFNAHLQITDISNALGSDMKRLEYEDSLFHRLENLPGVLEARPYLDRPAILESREGIDGIVAKGLMNKHPELFLADKLVQGSMPSLPDSVLGDGLLISRYLADRADVGIGDRVSLYFLGEGHDISTRRLEVTGIYSTDLEDFDKRYVFMDIRHLQKISAWGLEAQIYVSDSCENGQLKIEGRGYGGYDKTYSWSNGWTGKGPHYICPTEDMELQMILSDNAATLRDTAWLSLKTNGTTECDCGSVKHTTLTSGSSYESYIGGYELFVKDFNELDKVREELDANIGPFLYCSDIIERTPEIFSWLELLDVNIYIIIILMIGVALVNMSSALIITIIERSRMIGVLKAMGAENKSIRSIFIRHAARLIITGLVIGNILGLGLAFIQSQFGVIRLPAENYYLNKVPILVHWQDIVLIDLGTLTLCMLAMTIPSMLITRISPVKAIRFD